MSNILSFGKELILSKTTNFRHYQTERVCRQQIQIWWKKQKKGEVARHEQFFAPVAIGQQAFVMVHCASVCVLTFSLNIFFSETTYRILIKFHRNVPAI